MPISSSRMGSNRSQKGGISKAPKKGKKIKVRLTTKANKKAH